jgi:hypothetical protein
MNNKFERLWKEAVLAYLRALSQHLPGRSEENHRKPQSGKSITLACNHIFSVASQ